MHSSLLGTRNAGGFSPLHLAAQNGHNQSCREILLAGGDPDVQNNVSCEGGRGILDIFILIFTCNFSMATRPFTLHAVTAMREQLEFSYRPNVIQNELT